MSTRQIPWLCRSRGCSFPPYPSLATRLGLCIALSTRGRRVYQTAVRCVLSRVLENRSVSLLLRGDLWLASRDQAWPRVSFQCHLSNCSSRSEPQGPRPRGSASRREWLMTPTPGSALWSPLCLYGHRKRADFLVLDEDKVTNSSQLLPHPLFVQQNQILIVLTKQVR